MVMLSSDLNISVNYTQEKTVIVNMAAFRGGELMSNLEFFGEFIYKY